MESLTVFPLEAVGFSVVHLLTGAKIVGTIVVFVVSKMMRK
jgi:hypothetical protein